MSTDEPSTPTADLPPLISTDEDVEVQHVERLLSNGDFYTGQWAGNAPHGTGKYLWTDGCMYEGEWRNGKTMGEGKFSWPSGATYEGAFKNGFMDGIGTYTGTCGATYRGGWSMNLKHGHGKKSYNNGDYYDGEWRCGMQDGYGRYIWKNGIEYVGHWRAGVIHGRGTFVWGNVNRYDGGWEEGLRRGNGSFRWADGSLYIGFWSRDGKDINQKGVYYPSATATSPTARDPNEAFATDLIDCKVSPGETVSILPSQKMLNWSGIEADFLQKQAIWRSSKSVDCRRRRASVDVSTAESVTPTRRPNGHMNTNTMIDGFGLWESEGDQSGEVADDGGGTGAVPPDDGTEGNETTVRPPKSLQQQVQQMRFGQKETKRQGETISKGHKNYELMLNLQLGIR